MNSQLRIIRIERIFNEWILQLKLLMGTDFYRW